MQRFGVNYHRKIKMNGNLSKKLLAMAMSTLLLASMGAMAAKKTPVQCTGGKVVKGTCVCPKGQTLDNGVCK